MQKLKQFGYGIVTSSLLLVPMVVSAQWNLGFINAQSAGLPSDTIYRTIGRIMNWLLGILGFVAIIAFVIAGILYLTAAGNEGQIEKAKNAMTYSIIGIIVALVGFVAVRAIDGLLSAGNTQF
ncbi:MAG: MMCAP2_0565 family pilin-like conjugal transfer protein [Candidatus Moraniibacteriota bacterium]